MKNILPGLFVLVLLTLLVMACKDDSGVSGENPFQESVVVADEQVWKHNRSAVKISQVFQEYNGSHYILAMVYMPSNIYPFSQVPYLTPGVPNGEIKDGLLSFTVLESEMTGNLLKFNNEQCDLSTCTCDFKCYFECQHTHDAACSPCTHVCVGPDPDDPDYCGNHEKIILSSFFREWKNVKIDDPSAKGNVFIISALPDAAGVMGALDRHRFVGTENSMANETILYVYMEKDCVISGEPSQGFIPGNYYYYTQEALNLSLKKGFNLVTRGEKYLSYKPSETPNASAYISMEIRNPLEDPEKYRWTIELGFAF